MRVASWVNDSTWRRRWIARPGDFKGFGIGGTVAAPGCAVESGATRNPHENVDEARQQAASLRQRARRLRLRGFGGRADELEAHAVALHETADAIVAESHLPPPSA